MELLEEESQLDKMSMMLEHLRSQSVSKMLSVEPRQREPEFPDIGKNARHKCACPKEASSRDVCDDGSWAWSHTGWDLIG